MAGSQPSPLPQAPPQIYRSSWGAAPPLIITPGLPRGRPQHCGGWQQSTERDNSSSRWAWKKRPDYRLCDYCHPSPARQAGSGACSVLGLRAPHSWGATASHPFSAEQAGGWGFPSRKVCLEHMLLATDVAPLSPEQQNPSSSFVPECFWVGLALHTSPRASLGRNRQQATGPWPVTESQDNSFRVSDVVFHSTQNIPCSFICPSNFPSLHLSDHHFLLRTWQVPALWHVRGCEGG